MAEIYKAAGILIRDRKILMARSRDKPAFISPGGKIEAGETPPQALVRELREEFSITVSEADLEPFGSFTAEAANHPGQRVKIDIFVVAKWQGEIVSASEITEMRWLASRIPAGLQVGSIFAHEVLPRLRQQDLID